MNVRVMTMLMTMIGTFSCLIYLRLLSGWSILGEDNTSTLGCCGSASSATSGAAAAPFLSLVLFVEYECPALVLQADPFWNVLALFLAPLSFVS